jgi:transcriptional regulator with XRE-family HTH domain
MSEFTTADRCRELRRRRGWSQEDLAEAASISVASVRKLEQGGQLRMETLHKIARALDVVTVTFVSPTSPEPQEEVVDEMVLTEIRSAIRPPVGLSGRPLYDTVDDDEPDLSRLLQAISTVSAAYQNDRYDDLARFIPALVRSAHLHVDAYDGGARQLDAKRARANVLSLAGRYLIQVRAHELALTALHASLQDALAISDMPLAVASISGQAWAMLRQGRFREVELLGVEVAEEIEPRLSKASAEELSAWGWMLLWASRAASRNNRPEEAKTYLSTAVAAAAPLDHEHCMPDDMSTFGKVTVAVQGPQNALIAGRPDKALELSRNVSNDGIKSTEWRRYLLDIALAHVQTGDADRATGILSGLRRSAPLWLRYQQPARDITREILAARPRMPTQEQRELAEFMDIDG